MAALEKTRSTWHACFRIEEMPILMELRRVEIVRTKRDHDPTPYYWTTVNAVGWWPGTDSDEWIEYIPPIEECSDGTLAFKRPFDHRPYWTQPEGCPVCGTKETCGLCKSL